MEQDRDELQVQARIVNENNHDIAVRSLNDEQKMLFDMIIQGVENSLVRYQYDSSLRKPKFFRMVQNLYCCFVVGRQELENPML